MLRRYGITDPQRGFIASLSPAQVKFIKEPVKLQCWLIRSCHIVGYCLAGLVSYFLFGLGIDTFEQSAVLETEALVILTACWIITWDLPSHFWQLCMLQYPVRVIYPYGAVYLSASCRDFWSAWSRPASSLLRHMIYYPLGGSDHVLPSVPLLFLMNALAHCEVSNTLIGGRCLGGWLIVFGTLGTATLLEVLGNRHVCDNNQRVKIARALSAHIAFRIATFVLFHKCLMLSLSDLL